MDSENKIIIAIDGYASTGKSTLAKALAKELGYAYIDTGAMYRATTLFFLRHKIKLENDRAIQKALHAINIRFLPASEGNRLILNGEDVEDEIRKMYVSEMVSEVAAISAVRRTMVAQQREMGGEKGVVMDGRDIGTVVFRDAELKIFLTANSEVRTKRRLEELVAKGLEVKEDEVGANLTHRDHIDSTRADSPLKKAKDAIEIDNSYISQEEQLLLALNYAKTKILDFSRG